MLNPDIGSRFVLNLDIGSRIEVKGKTYILTKPRLSGHAVYGPYQPLPPGRYAVEFNITAVAWQRFDSDGVCAVVDVASDFGRSISVSQKVLLSQLRDGPLSIHLDFDVTTPETFEFRVFVTGSASLVIEGIEEITDCALTSRVLWKNQAFKIAYGGPPSATEMEQVRSFGLEEANDAGQIRSVPRFHAGPTHPVRVQAPKCGPKQVAGLEPLKLLRQGFQIWNAWRAGNPSIQPDVSYADLSYADLSYADLSGSNLSGAMLFAASLSWADLSRVDLSDAHLGHAHLRWANLAGANLTGAYLGGANLSGANLSGANLRGADLGVDRL